MVSLHCDMVSKLLKQGNIICYADGSYYQNQGGCGIVIQKYDRLETFGKTLTCKNGLQAELHAIQMCLEKLLHLKSLFFSFVPHVYIFCDCKNVIEYILNNGKKDNVKRKQYLKNKNQFYTYNS